MLDFRVSDVRAALRYGVDDGQCHQYVAYQPTTEERAAQGVPEEMSRDPINSVDTTMRDPKRQLRFQRMRVVEPEIASDSTIIKGFCKIGDLEQGFQLFSQMTRRGTKPDAISFRWPRSQFDVGCILSRIGVPEDKFEHGRFFFTSIPRKSTVAVS